MEEGCEDMERCLRDRKGQVRCFKGERKVRLKYLMGNGGVGTHTQRLLFPSAQATKELDGGESPRKRRKVEDETPSGNTASEGDWKAFEQDVTTFEAQHVLAKSKFVFTFVEGPLIKALRQGHW